MNKTEQIMYILLCGISIFFIFPILELLIDQEITRDFTLLGALIGGGIIFTGVITTLFPPVSQNVQKAKDKGDKS